MDWSTVLTILQDWFAPTGIVVMAIGWWRDRRLTKVRAVKENEGVYHQLYDDLSATTLKLSDQIRKVNGKIIIFEQAFRRCHQCRFAEHCPALIFLRSKQGEPDSRPLGSLQRSGTEVITSAKDPMRMASLTLEPERLRMIASLPKNIGVQKQENGLNLRIESDGEGGVNVTAQTEGKQEITIERTFAENSETDEMLKEETTPSPSFWERAKIKVIGLCLICLLLLTGSRWLKSKLKNNLN